MVMAESAQKIVQLARRQDRLTTFDYATQVFDDFIEFHGDRNFRDDGAIIGGIARLAGRPVTIVGIQKGKSLQDNLDRNFGQPHPEGYRKALRLMKQAEKFGRPIITFINTAGAFPGSGAEERGQGEAIARNLLAMSDLKVPIVAIINGEGGSGGALALAVADKVWMLENAMYSILSPEGFATILWKDSRGAAEAAELLKMTSKDLLENGVIDKIIPEENVIEDLKTALIFEIASLSELSVDELICQRYERFRKY
jgi:acetyl-CoA carboxylase carboxyl transferase subunit alpha